MESITIYNNLWPYVNGLKERPIVDQTLIKDWDGKYINAQRKFFFLSRHANFKRCFEKVNIQKCSIKKAVKCKHLYHMKKAPEEFMIENIQNFIGKAEELSEGFKFQVNCKRLCYLKRYKNFRIATDSSDEVLTLEELRFKSIEDKARIKNRSYKFSKHF